MQILLHAPVAALDQSVGLYSPCVYIQMDGSKHMLQNMAFIITLQSMDFLI